MFVYKCLKGSKLTNPFGDSTPSQPGESFFNDKINQYSFLDLNKIISFLDAILHCSKYHVLQC